MAQDQSMGKDILMSLGSRSRASTEDSNCEQRSVESGSGDLCSDFLLNLATDDEKLEQINEQDFILI